MVRRAVRIMRRAALVGCALGAALNSPVARAENVLDHSVPAADTTVAAPPTSLQLGFTERIGGSPVVTLVCDSSVVPLGTVIPSEGLSALSVQIVGQIAPGAKCSVGWKVNGTDNKPNGIGSFEFSVAKSAATTLNGGTAAPGTTVDAKPVPSPVAAPSNLRGPLGLARLVANLGLAALLGALVLIATAWPEGPEYILTTRYLRSACIVAILGSFATVVVMAAIRSGGGLADGFSPSAWLDVKDLPGGAAALVRLFLSIACVWVAMRPERVTDSTYQLQALAIPGIAVATLAFTRGTEVGLPVLVGGIVHAVAMSVWLGGLALLARVVLVGSGDEDLVHAVRGFQRISFPAIVVTCASGLLLVHQLDWGKLFDSSHGRLVLVKVIVVAVMIFLGVATREFIRERLSRVDTLSAGLAGRLQRAISLEALVGVLAIGVTAGLTSLAPPGLVKPPVKLPDLGPTYPLINTENKFSAKIRLTERLGSNAVWMQILTPKDGIQDVQLKFVPPQDAPNGRAVLLRVPLTGAGTAMIAKDQNLPLNVPGTWEVVCYVHSVLMGSVRVTVKSDLGTSTTTGGG